MLRLIQSRGTGKTTEILKIARRKGYAVVVATNAMKNYFMRENRDIQFFSAMEFSVIMAENGPKANEIKEKGVLVDEMEMCLFAMFGGALKGYSASIEDGHEMEYLR